MGGGEVGGGGRLEGGGGQKMTPHMFGSNIINVFGFFSILSRKRASGSRVHGVCMRRSGASTYAVPAFFNHLPKNVRSKPGRHT